MHNMAWSKVWALTIAAREASRALKTKQHDPAGQLLANDRRLMCRTHCLVCKVRGLLIRLCMYTSRDVSNRPQSCSVRGTVTPPQPSHAKQRNCNIIDLHQLLRARWQRETSMSTLERLPQIHQTAQSYGHLINYSCIATRFHASVLLSASYAKHAARQITQNNNAWQKTA